MRGVLLLLLSCSVACVDEGRFDPGDPGGLSGPILCHYDDGCPPGDVCARNDICYPASAVRAASVTWTLRGAAADATSCGPAPNLEIGFSAAAGSQFGNYSPIGFAPVPCVEGKFSIDKLPTQLDEVVLGNHDVGTKAGTLDQNGQLNLDLPF